jgi:hypothetical protein
LGGRDALSVIKFTFDPKRTIFQNSRNGRAMGRWEISACGEGFLRADKELGFFLNGFVCAGNANKAFLRVVALAKQDCPEISQAEKVGFPRPVINAEEIHEVTGELSDAQEGVNLFWDEQEEN